MSFSTWLHHLLEPHCAACAAEREESRICQSCETLKHQIEVLNYNNRQLTDALIEATKPKQVNEPSVQVDYSKIEKPRTIPWAARRQMLEAEDKKQAQIIAEQKKQQEDLKKRLEIEKLEKEVGIPTEGVG